MEIKVTSRTDNQVEFTVSVNAAELAAIKTEVYNHLRPKVKAAGFRPGKAPDAIVEREMGSNAVQSEVLDHALQHTYADAIRKENFNVVASPEISIEKFVPYTQLEYKAKIEILAKPKLADYKKFSIKRPHIKHDAAKVEQMIEDLRRRHSVRLESEQPAKTGNEINFDFAGTRDGSKVPGASAKGQTLQLGSGNFIPGFEDQIIGLTAGQDKTFDIQFPKNYHEATLAGQMVTFEVHINTVTDLVLPEVNDEFAAQVGPFTSVADFRADLTSQVASEAEEAAAREHEKAILDELIAKSTFSTPDALINQQLDRMQGELEQNLAGSGLSFEKYLELTKKTKDETLAEMRPEAQRRVGLAILLTEVSRAENLTISKAELDDEINRLKAQYTDPATQSQLDSDGTREEVYNHLMASRVISTLISYAEAK